MSMENRNDKKSLFYRLLIATAIVIPVAISFSYAYFLAEVKGNKTNVTGTAVTNFDFSLTTNTETGYINTSELIPISDSLADSDASVGTFTVSAGNNPYPIKFSVYLTDIVMDSELKNADFKWKLSSANNDIESGSFSGYTSGDLLLTSNLIINSNSSSTYQLRIWISETTADQSAILNKSFSARVKVEGEFWNSTFFNDYQMVEYIENPSTAYIDTGVASYLGLESFGNMSFTTVPTTAVMMGARSGSGNRVSMLQISSSKWAIGYGNIYTSSIAVNANTMYFFHSRVYSKDVLLEINNVKGYSSSANFPSTVPVYNIYLFAEHLGAQVLDNTAGRLYNLNIYYNGPMVRSFVPCYRISDDVVGVYDVINDVFYTSANSVALVAGPDLT